MAKCERFMGENISTGKNEHVLTATIGQDSLEGSIQGLQFRKRLNFKQHDVLQMRKPTERLEVLTMYKGEAILCNACGGRSFITSKNK